ncbi:MAG: response regulator transcription factor [Variovorax sp.]
MQRNYATRSIQIAAIDSDKSDLDGNRKTVEQIGCSFRGFSSAREFMMEVRHQYFDLLLLDWELPEMSGTALVEWLQHEHHNDIPVIFVAEDKNSRVAEGLMAGADDFVAKERRSAELGARIHALLRRACPTFQIAPLRFGPYRFVQGTNTVEVHGVPVALQTREFELLRFLFENMGTLLPRRLLHEKLWRASVPHSRALDTHISRLRTKLDLCERNGFVLSAVYGFGYRLDSLIHLPGSKISATLTADLPGLFRGEARMSDR